ncbi:hypothetical protein BBO_00342 [Beauveria brongniartii RCEF 3172]|uniref:Rhodopsin domain-containing protein n=1 Tax=Beauveria brongniartii RCEF 3172 TaxID=1081107 RepID=A0A167L1K6_9HYPO|nr:hypothetical protein BBO_00342 [Beauveria brongniartii RCEF 3172]
MGTQNVPEKADKEGLIACLCVGIVFVITRTGARLYKLRKIPHQMEDIFMYLALVSFIITVALYYATIDTFFRVNAISDGQREPYAKLPKDLDVMLKEFFVVQFFFWLTLWAVKWSLLFMFKRLTKGLPRYTQVWWGVLVYSVLVFIGCCISNFTSCSSLKAWFTAGECSTSARDSHAKEISLWFSLAADLSTDILIMAIPLRVLWSLKMARLEKMSIGLIFVVGLITMATAIIRSVSLNSSSSSGQVSTTWLMLWAGIEGVVGCLPSFVIFIHGRVAASKVQNEEKSHQSPPDCNSKAKSCERANSSGSRDPSPLWAALDYSSDKSLVDGVAVTRSGTQKWHSPNQRQAPPRDSEAVDELNPLPPS